MTTTAPYLTPNVQHITRLFRKAPHEDIVKGARWYEEAHAIATTFAERYSLSVEQVAGVLAAISPMQSWASNVKLGERILAGRGELTEGAGLRTNTAKANRIIKGEAPLDVLGGDKVRNFYLSILTKGAEGITIDRHAYDLACNTRHNEGERPQLKGARYAEYQGVYSRAAEILSFELAMPLTAGQVQSVTWELWRSKHWAKGAFDVKVAA